MVSVLGRQQVKVLPAGAARWVTAVGRVQAGVLDQVLPFQGSSSPRVMTVDDVVRETPAAFAVTFSGQR